MSSTDREITKPYATSKPMANTHIKRISNQVKSFLVFEVQVDRDTIP